MVEREATVIKIIGPINEDTLSVFLEELDAESQSQSVVRILLSSEGGTALDALAYVSAIRRCKRRVAVCATGVVMSAATLILAAGTKGLRYIHKEAWVMVHEDSGKVKGTVSQMEREVFRLRRMEDQWCVLLEEYTGTSAKTWSKLHAEGDTYLSADECLALGLIDKII